MNNLWEMRKSLTIYHDLIEGALNRGDYCAASAYASEIVNVNKHLESHDNSMRNCASAIRDYCITHA